MLYAIELKNVWLVLLKVSNFEMSFCVFKSSKKQRNVFQDFCLSL